MTQIPALAGDKRPSSAPSSPHVLRCRGRFGAFTLVELLVVIGIIAVLIGILLPALTRARQQSQRTACAAKLQQIMVAANVHRSDHKDYYPLTGLLNGGQPEELADPNIQYYDYRDSTAAAGWTAPSGVTRFVAPIFVALGTEMGFQANLWYTHDQTATATVDQNGVYRNFRCPTHYLTLQDYNSLEPWSPGYIIHYTGTVGPAGNYSWAIHGEPNSYIFNEYVLGVNDTYRRLRGHASMVHQPSITFFACDGIGDPNTTPNRNTEAGGYNPGFGCFTFYNNFPNTSLPSNQGNLSGGPAISLLDILNSKTYGGIVVGGPASGFDAIRHQKQMNIAFCDGHVETRTIVTANNQPANGLANVYLIPPN